MGADLSHVSFYAIVLCHRSMTSFYDKSRYKVLDLEMAEGWQVILIFRQHHIDHILDLCQ